MEQIPIRDGDHPDNVVPISPGRSEVEPPAPQPPTEPAAPTLGPLVEQSARVVAGFVSALVTATAGAVSAGVPPARADVEDGELPDDVLPVAVPSPVGVAAGAAAGLAIEASQAAARGLTAFADAAGPFLSWFANAAVVRRGLADVDGRVHGLNERWEEERGPSEAAAAAFAAAVIPRIADAVLERIDLTRVVTENVDLDAIVGSIDLNQIIERIDIDAVVQRVDIEAIIGRVDLVAIADEVITEVDLPELIRESTGAVTSETLRTVRMTTAQADRLLARVVDRLLFRHDDRSTEAPSGDGS